MLPPTATKHQTSTRRDRQNWLGWFVLVGSITFALLGWAITRNSVNKADRARFERLSKRTSESIANRFDDVADLLHATRGLSQTHPHSTARDWAMYLRNLIPRLDNGIVGIGYIERVARQDLTAFEMRIQSQGYPHYQVERVGDNPWLYAVVVIEPAEKNTGVAGLDIGSGTNRRIAAETAAREDRLTLSRRIRLNFENREVAGCLLLLPVYQPGTEPTTEAERLAALRGWVYASIRIDQLLDGIVAGTANQVDFEVFEGDATSTTTLLYDADRHLKDGQPRLITDTDFADRRFNISLPLHIHGQHWTVRMSSRPEFDQQSNTSLPWIVLGGGIAFTLFSVALFRVSSGARLQAVKIAEEMTHELRRTQEEASKLALVASLTTNIVVITDEKWRIAWINDGFTRILGYTLAESLGQRPNHFLLSPQTHRPTLLALIRAGRAGRSFRCEVILRSKTQQDIWVDMELQPVRNTDGQITGYISVQQDITARKQATAEIVAAKEAAEQANVAKSQFLAMMSHEIRTPMNGVIGMTSLLLDSPLTPEQHEYAETIRVSGDSLLIIINDILDFSKIESGRLDLEKIEFSLRECVEGSLDLLASRAAQKHLDLLYEIDDHIPSQIVGDPTRLRQIIVNLLGNAVKFTERGEVHLTLRASPLENGQTEFTFSVRDTGIGIPLEAQGKLFQSFTQVDASTTRKFGGTGLGLAISKRLTELMGGRMWIESQLGQGTTFFFTIKADIAARKPRPFVSEQSAPQLIGRRLLIVDDNPMNVRILASLAAKWGLHTQEALSAQSALQTLTSGAVFDAAILDMHMPDMDGSMLATAIRAHPALRHLPLILLSSVGQDQMENSTVFSAHLTKPAKPAQIHHLLIRLLGGTTTTSSSPSMPTPTTIGHASGARILLADDNTVNQRVALLMLSRLGYRADLAADGHEVIAAVHRQPYDIILMDVQMPGMDGYETTRQLIQLYPEAQRRPWVIALTAGAMEGDRELCLQAGMNDYLSKPLKNAELSAALNRAEPRTVTRIDSRSPS